MEQRTREQLEDKYKWSLDLLYPSDQVWQLDFDKFAKDYLKLVSYKGSLHQASPLISFLKEFMELQVNMEHLYVYAGMRFTEDTSSQIAQHMKGSIEQLVSQFSSAYVFVSQELSALMPEQINDLIKAEAGLNEFKYFLEQYSRFQPHILSEQTEKVLADLSPVIDASHDIFSALNDTNFRFDDFEFNGVTYPLSHGLYQKYLESPDREFRAEVFRLYNQPFHQHLETLAACYSTMVQAAVKTAQFRHHKSSVEMSLFANELPVSIYDALIKTAEQGSTALAAFNVYKKQIFKIDELRQYDAYLPLPDETRNEYTYEECVEITRKAMAPLGQDYLNKFEDSLKARVVDVFETPNKQSGAYSWGSYRSRGYVFLNFSGRMRDISTFAHEFGHTLHRDYSCQNQPSWYSDNPIFLAEIASTFNECLLLDYLIANAKDAKEKRAYIFQYLQNIAATFFRQSMFGDFERQAHVAVENGEVLTAQRLTELYSENWQKYYAKEVTLDENVAIEWSRIPHFYRPFYVFKYATSLCAAIAMSEKVSAHEPGALEGYLKFLGSGSHKPPLEILKDAGLDMTDVQTYQYVVNKFEKLLQELKNL